MKNYPLTERRKAEINTLEAMPDSGIDTSDIPEIADDRWALALKGNLYRPVKQSVTIRLDADILDWFKSHTKGRGYQTDINVVLRQHVAQQLKRGS